MDYFGLYVDLLRIGSRAFYYFATGRLSKAAGLMDECARFRADIRSRGLISDEMVTVACVRAETPFVR